jgi:hypothetical protein
MRSGVAMIGARGLEPLTRWALASGARGEVDGVEGINGIEGVEGIDGVKAGGEDPNAAGAESAESAELIGMEPNSAAAPFRKLRRCIFISLFLSSNQCGQAQQKRPVFSTSKVDFMGVFSQMRVSRHLN